MVEFRNAVPHQPRLNHSTETFAPAGLRQGDKTFACSTIGPLVSLDQYFHLEKGTIMAETTVKPSTKKPATKTAVASAKPVAKKPAASKAAVAKVAEVKPAPVEKKPAAKKPAVKKTETSGKSAVKKPAKGMKVSDEQRYRMVAEAAYYRAESNQFKSDPLRDWIEAEKDIATLLSGND